LCVEKGEMQHWPKNRFVALTMEVEQDPIGKKTKIWGSILEKEKDIKERNTERK
jgi:hypothetical protein